ncbi:MAG: hypothetical protein ACJ8A6_15385 [Gemmatimonadales bacterium]
MRSISFRLNRRGAVLPLTIIVLGMMAVAVAISYARISSERVTTSDVKAQQGAFAVAQSGLNRFLANLNGKPAYNPALWPANPIIQTVNYNDLPGGTAQVDLVMLRESTITLLPAVYVITSRGRYTAAKRWNSRSPSAERTVATYAIWTPTPFDLNGAFTSLGSVGYNGTSAIVSGVDRCAVNPTTAGLAVPNGDSTGFNHPEVIDGVPDNTGANLGTPGPGGTAVNNVNIDWAAVRAGTAFPADRIYPTQTWLPMTGASPSMADWPVTRVNGDLTLPGSGNGILIVTGNLTWNGTPLKTWQGVILVGGSITMNGNGNIYGALITNLNVKTGNVALTSDLGNGTKTLQYDSCAINRATSHIGSVQRVRNAWTDSWSSY